MIDTAIGLRATIPLYQGGAQRSRVREAKSRAREKQYALMDTQKNVRATILRHWKTQEMAKQEMDSRAQEIDAAKKARLGVEEEARMGERTVIDILDADQDIINAQSARVRARCDNIIAIFSLARAMGIFSPEAMGFTDIAYDPGDHYRAAGDKLLTLNDE